MAGSDVDWEQMKKKLIDQAETGGMIRALTWVLTVFETDTKVVLVTSDLCEQVIAKINSLKRKA